MCTKRERHEVFAIGEAGEGRAASCQEPIETRAMIRATRTFPHEKVASMGRVSLLHSPRVTTAAALIRR